jgi:hypothetical protein
VPDFDRMCESIDASSLCGGNPPLETSDETDIPIPLLPREFPDVDDLKTTGVPDVDDLKTTGVPDVGDLKTTGVPDVDDVKTTGVSCVEEGCDAFEMEETVVRSFTLGCIGGVNLPINFSPVMNGCNFAC